MAAPKPATPNPVKKKTKTPLDKLIRLSKSLEFTWFMGHLIVLFFSLFFLLSFKASIYKIIYLGVLNSFGIIIYQQHVLKSIPKDAQSILNDENFSYFVLALVWLVMPVNMFSIIPYLIFATFHVLKYLENTLLPTVLNINKDTNKYVKIIANFTEQYNEKCMFWVASSELFIFIINFLKVFLWYKRSWIIFVLYSLFIKVRYENSKYLRLICAQWRVRVDGIISLPQIPPPVKRGYNFLKLKLIELSEYQLTKPNVAPASSTAGSTANKGK